MESATVRRAPPLPGVIQAGLIAGLMVLALVAWALTGDRMSGMDAGPGTDLGTLGFYVTAWVVMMAAMMFPSIWPMVVMFARIQEGKRARGDEVAAGTVSLFVAGYLVTWTAWGLAAYALFKVGEQVAPGFLAWDRGGQYLAGGVIVAAAIYQLTPLKDVCLRKCRSPFMFLMTAWRPGRAGSFRMGLEHGGWCVGCCWGLMGALFALGVMSIGWMVFIAGLIALEKLLPWRILANRAIATVLLVLGLAVAFAPESVPGLTLPNSPEAARAMQSMGMGSQDSTGHGSGGGMNGDSMP